MIALQIRSGAVDDHATKILLNIRNDIARTENKMKERQIPSCALKLVRINSTAKIQKRKTGLQKNMLSNKFHIGDSVMIFPDKKIGIVCQPVNEKGVLRVQLQNKKIWINHKRVKLHVPASQLYTEDYDFSIIFDSVEQRKLRHDMSRKYTEEMLSYDENR